MPATASSQVLTSVRTVGGLLPADMLIRIAEGKDVSGSRPADYHVVGVRSVQDAAERHWDFLKGAWRALRDAIGDAGHDPSGLAVENWLLPLFEEHGFGRLERIPAGIQSTDRTATFPVTHRWRHVPIHLVGWDTDLDHRVPGGGLPPQSMLQECLNRSDEHLWGLSVQRPAAPAAAGLLRRWRAPRSSRSTWRRCSTGSCSTSSSCSTGFCTSPVSRFRTAPRRRPAGWRSGGSRRSRPGRVPWISSATEWRRRSPTSAPASSGIRRTTGSARTWTRICSSGRCCAWCTGCCSGSSPRTGTCCCTRMRTRPPGPGTRSTTPRRGCAPPRCAASAPRTATCGGRSGSSSNALGDEDGLPRLGLAGLGGIYDDTGTDQILRGLELSNEHLLAAVKSLARVYDKSARRWRRVDYQNLGAEELGSIYESLLELVPKWSKEKREFLLDVMPGNERKSTGSYYTPTSLIDCLLDSTLDPVLDDAQKRAEVAATNAGTDPSLAIADALLAVTVCDPACGSGHFLVAAARRIAKRLAAVREHNPEPTVEALRTALRDVVKHCIYGVDVNPMAVELAKVSLWLEALEPGKPLGFLDAHIKCGNALIGATPALIDQGIPDKAFKPVEGDDAAVGCVACAGPTPTTDPDQDELFSDRFIFSQSNEDLATQLAPIADAPDGSLRDVHRQAAAYRAWEQSPENEHTHQVADAWCAAFVWRKTKDAPPAIVNRVFRALREQGIAAIPPATATEIARLKAEYGFFHWHLEFPDIFRVPDGVDPAVDPATGWSGGFTCVLGNPPWDKVDFEDKKYFSKVEPSIAALAGQTRRARIAEWQQENPDQAARYRAARRKVKATFLFASSSGAFPLCAKGLTAQGRQLSCRPTSCSPNGSPRSPRPPAASAASSRPPSPPAPAASTCSATSPSAAPSPRCTTSRTASRSSPTWTHGRSSACSPWSARRCASPPRGSRSSCWTPPTSTTLGGSSRSAQRRSPSSTRTPGHCRSSATAGTPTSPPRSTAASRCCGTRRSETATPGASLSSDLFDMTDDSDLFRTRETLEADGWHLHGNVFTRAGKRMLPLYEAKMVDFFNHRCS